MFDDMLSFTKIFEKFISKLKLHEIDFLILDFRQYFC